MIIKLADTKQNFIFIKLAIFENKHGGLWSSALVTWPQKTLKKTKHSLLILTERDVPLRFKKMHPKSPMKNDYKIIAPTQGKVRDE